MIRIKRVYEPPARSDGRRILVDRLWPRGLSKERAKVDVWVRDVAPSDELRRWFDHRKERWEEFQRRYANELDENPEALAELEEAIRGRRVTLLFATREEHANNAHALKRYLEGGRRGGAPGDAA